LAGDFHFATEPDMPNWNILIADGLEAGGQAILRAEARVEDRTGLSAGELLVEIGEYEALIVRSRTMVTAEVFAAAPRLKVVGRAGVGVDNIDLAAATNHNVTVVNAPMSTTLAVAELTIGLMFALARFILRADAAMKSGQWIKTELQGSELGGKTLGIMGMGRIGAEVAQRAAALGIAPVGYDPLIPEDEIRQRGAEPLALNDLYARSDYISLHLPLSPDTRNLISGQALGRMKRGVRLVCAARGGIIDETALLGALDRGRLRRSMDVFNKNRRDRPGGAPNVSPPPISVRRRPKPRRAPRWISPGKCWQRSVERSSAGKWFKYLVGECEKAAFTHQNEIF
jgi:D-3-phosphoglycerate dehydrogenase